ncbi:hypothetical protein P3L10_020004 [Capsicum annuum]
MAWACEAITSLRKQFKDYPDEITRQLHLVQYMGYLTVDLIKKKLVGSTSIRRAVRQGLPNAEAFHNQPQTVIDSGASSGGVDGGVVCDGDSHRAVASHDYKHSQQKINTFENIPCTGPSHPYTSPFHPYSGPSNPSSPSCSHCKCKVCNDREDKILENLEAIPEVAEDLKSRRDVIHPSVIDVQGPLKKVDIFVALGKEKGEAFIYCQRLQEYGKYVCVVQGKYYVDEILYLMRGKQLAYPDAYDVADRIMDLNFYNNFKDRYIDLYKQADSGGPELDQLVSTFQWDEQTIKYIRGKRLYPHGKSWTKAKRIVASRTWKSNTFSQLRYYSMMERLRFMIAT